MRLVAVDSPASRFIAVAPSDRVVPIGAATPALLRTRESRNGPSRAWQHHDHFGCQVRKLVYDSSSWCTTRPSAVISIVRRARTGGRSCTNPIFALECLPATRR